MLYLNADYSKCCIAQVEGKALKKLDEYNSQIEGEIDLICEACYTSDVNGWCIRFLLKL